MKLLIVDDEALARAGIKSIVPWEKRGYRVVGEAVNGLEALRMTREFHPDIILVDILMPEMNGLDFISQIRNEFPLCKFIILSCANDIEYYKKAISLGVSEYIQKNLINAEQILQVVDRVAEDIRKERVFDTNENEGKAYVNRYVVLTEFLNMVLKGQINDGDLIERKLHSYIINTFSNNLYVMAFSEGADADSGVVTADELKYSAVNICQEIINDMGKGFIFVNYLGRITAIFSCPDGCDEKKLLMDLCYRIQETVNQYIDMSFEIGISERMNDYGAISMGYSQAVEMLENIYFCRKEKVYFHSDSKSSGEALSIIEKEKAKITGCETLMETDYIKSGLEVIVNTMMSIQEFTPKNARAVYLDILYHIIGLIHKEKIQLKDIFGPDFNPLEYVEKPANIEKLNRQLINTIDDVKKYYLNMVNDRNSQYIACIKHYIDEHVGEKITLEMISRVVHMNPAYVCRLFKKATGENLTDYILKLKVEKSKHMLKDMKNLTEIAEATGFSSESYFIKVFKSYTGKTPGQYIKSVLEK